MSCQKHKGTGLFDGLLTMIAVHRLGARGLAGKYILVKFIKDGDLEVRLFDEAGVEVDGGDGRPYRTRADRENGKDTADQDWVFQMGCWFDSLEGSEVRVDLVKNKIDGVLGIAIRVGEALW